MLVKGALTSNETKISSSGFIERCLIFLIKSVLCLTKDEVLLLCKVGDVCFGEMLVN